MSSSRRMHGTKAGIKDLVVEQGFGARLGSGMLGHGIYSTLPGARASQNSTCRRQPPPGSRSGCSSVGRCSASNSIARGVPHVHGDAFSFPRACAVGAQAARLIGRPGQAGRSTRVVWTSVLRV